MMVEVFADRADYIEKIVTGISRIRNAVRDHGHSTVEFVFTGFFTERFSRGELFEDKTVENDLEGIGTLNGGLSGTLRLLLECIIHNPGIQVKELSKSLNRPIDTLDKQIRNLIDKDFIVRSSRKAGGYWITGSGDEKNGTLNGGLKLIIECINESPGMQAHIISDKLERPLDTVKNK